jgi:TetR/AcrR family transcriptional regulator, transcriptional repressor for nem operon
MARTREFDVDTALDAAVRAFWQGGFESVSVLELCRAMGVRPGSAYAAFGGKRDLFAAALRRYAETVSAEAVARITSAPTGLGGIRDYFAHLVDAMVDGDRRWGCLITNSLVELADRDPDLTGVMTLHLANLRAAFAAALTRADAAGELRPGIGANEADLLVAVVQGLNVLAKTRPGRPALARIADSAVAGLLP